MAETQNTNPAPSARSHRLIIRLLALGFSLVIALIVGEIAMRVLHVVPDIRDEFPGLMILYQTDPQIDYCPRPSVVAQVPDETGRMVTIRTDENGFRLDSTIPPATSQPAVAVIGDSFTANLNTDDGQTLTAQLSQLLGGRQVLNFGVLGYSNVQELILAKRWLPKYKIGALVLAICASNDLIENLTFTRGNKGIDFHINGPSTLHRIARRSELVTFAYRALQTMATKTIFDHYDLGRGLDKELIEYDKQLPSDAAAEYAAAVQVSVDALSDFKKMADQLDAPRLVVLIPAKAMVYREILFVTNSQIDPRADLALGTVTHRGLDFDKIRNTWSTIAQKADVPFLDLTDLFRAHRDEVLYGQVDRHWNVRGQQLAAQAIAKAMAHNPTTAPFAGAESQ